METLDKLIDGAADYYRPMRREAEDSLDHDGDGNQNHAGSWGEMIGGTAGALAGMASTALQGGRADTLDDTVEFGVKGAGYGASAFDYLFGD